MGTFLKLIGFGVGILIVILLVGMLFGGEGEPQQPEKKQQSQEELEQRLRDKEPLKPENKTGAKQQVPSKVCKFPTFTKYIRGQPLKTKDEGHVAEVMVDMFNADPTNFHPVGGIGDPFVLRENGKFRMWFTGTKDVEPEILGTAYSESDDGIVWSDPKHAEHHINLVLEHGASGFDAYGIETVSVVKNIKDNLYYLYHTGNVKQHPNIFHNIGLATSTDGLTWDKRSTPVMQDTLSWEHEVSTGEGSIGGVLEPSVLYDNGQFKMWYAGFGVYDQAEGFSQIGYATSADGTTWKKHTTPVLTTGNKGSWDDSYVSHTHVIEDPVEGYHLFYAGGESSTGDTMRIGHAYSEDGIDWKKNPNNPILEGSAETWDAGMVGGPSALFVDYTIYLYYMGSEKPNFGSAIYFGLATGTCS